MELNDEQRVELSKEVLISTVDKVCQPDSTLCAVMVVTDGARMSIVPVRVSQKDAFSLLVAACTVLEPDEFKTDIGDMH